MFQCIPQRIYLLFKHNKVIQFIPITLIQFVPLIASKQVL